MAARRLVSPTPRFPASWIIVSKAATMRLRVSAAFLMSGARNSIGFSLPVGLCPSPYISAMKTT
jgi:hypothetical protein